MGQVMNVKLQRKGNNETLWMVWPGDTAARGRVNAVSLRTHHRGPVTLAAGDVACINAGVAGVAPLCCRVHSLPCIFSSYVSAASLARMLPRPFAAPRAVSVDPRSEHSAETLATILFI